MAAVQWYSRGRNYDAELQMCRPEAMPVEFGDYHPLKPIMVTDTKTSRGTRKGSTSSSSSSSSSAPPDPLSSMLDGTDPLSLFAAASATETSTMSHSSFTGDHGRKRKEKQEETMGPDFEPWSSKRGEILARFTTTEKLSINLFMGSDKGKAPNPGSSAVSEKVRNRLEELDDLEEGSQRELLNLSQQDYANRIEELNQSLKEAWASDQKVKALKIVIQCSKLLSDTAVIQFYPSKFVLITDILDTFGRLVFDRIWTMCSDPRPLPDSFTVEDVNDTAKETCLNWFFKIASIRELLPRLYVETAILKCNRFLNKLGIQVALANQCLSQADAFLKTAVGVLPEVPRSISVEGKFRSSESFLLDFINNFLATLLVVPDHPEHGVLYLVRGLLNMVQDYTWEDNSDGKVRVYVSALPLLAAMSQETYLYSIPKMDSNETLYGGDPKFLSEINKLCETLIGQILDHLKALARDEQNARRQSTLAFSLFGVLLAHGDLRNIKLNQLAINLWNLSHKHGHCETRVSVRTLESMKLQARQPDLAHLSDTVQRLTLQSRT